MARINIRDVPDEVYDVLVKGAQQNHQSLNAFVLDRLAESAKVIDMADYVASYQPPANTGVSVDDAVSAVREARDAS